MISGEKGVFISWILKRENAKKMVLFFFNVLNEKLFNKPYEHSLKKYPEDIKQYYLKLCSIEQSFKYAFNDGPPILNSDLNTSPTSVQLASHLHSLSNKDINWRLNLRDPEDDASLHRFNWILYLLKKERLDEKEVDWIIVQLDRWVHNFQNEMKSSKLSLTSKTRWDSYTIGERISNILLFHHLVNIKISEQIMDALILQTKFLISKLEYFDKYTGNHIINNARSIYCSGIAFSSVYWMEFASKIIFRELPKLVTQEGFLREGSSHYQLLFTRWLIELYYFSITFKDITFSRFLEKYLEPLIKGCFFFFVKNKKSYKYIIPLFGDISPDFKPNWLIDFFDLNAQKTRASYFDVIWNNPFLKKNLVNNEKNIIIKDQLKLENPKSGWFRYKKFGQDIFFRSEKKGIPDYMGHYHWDFGHFCLFYKGNPILVDAGRENYLGSFGLSQEAHNTIKVDDFKFVPSKHHLFHPDYSDLNNDFKSFVHEDYIKTTFETSCIKRVDKSFSWERITLIDKKAFKLKDVFICSKKHVLKLYFHFDNKLKLIKEKKSSFLIKGEDIKAYLTFESNSEIEVKLHNGGLLRYGWQATEYGKNSPSYTLEVICNFVHTNCEVNCIINWG